MQYDYFLGMSDEGLKYFLNVMRLVIGIAAMLSSLSNFIFFLFQFYECNRSCREEDFAPDSYSCAARIDAICSFAHTDASRVESGGQRDQNRR